MDSDRIREQAEINYYRDAETESPEADSLGNIINKITDCQVFLEVIDHYSPYFMGDKRILEIGGGQGWASCTLKKIYPQAEIILTDISKYALESLHKWEDIFKVKIDQSYPCTTYEIREEDASIDIIFSYAAAHHFTRLEDSMREILRILKPGGSCFFFHEPTTSRMLYRFAYKRVNRIRSAVQEDVIVYRDMIKLAEKCGFKAEINFFPSLLKRGPVETIYYFVLSKLPLLQWLLPCTANFHFLKR